VSGDAPDGVVDRVRRVCLGFPEVVEEQAWVGTRWRIRGKTFAHVLAIDEEWPPAYVRAAGIDHPATLLMFRSTGPELDALRAGGPPFFGPPWRADEVGMVLADDVDWAEVGELLTESYCTQAPRKLAATVDRPGG
jgi:YjbR